MRLSLLTEPSPVLIVCKDKGGCIWSERNLLCLLPVVIAMSKGEAVLGDVSLDVDVTSQLCDVLEFVGDA